MYRVTLTVPDDLDAFRAAVRGLIEDAAPPDDVAWQVGGSGELFGDRTPRSDAPALSVPAAYGPLAEDAICHSDPERFALLYRLLWRIVHGERELLSVAADPLVHRLLRMQKAVRRDRHKMTAFVRFRAVQDDAGERYVAWFEPEHFILRSIAPFFIDRFAAMRWSILTPNGSLHWDGDLTIGPAVSRRDAPPDDAMEDWWKRYYRATFNPARANPDAMRAEMPKRYWRNLPEATLIPDLLAEAAQRTSAMIAAPAPKARAAPGWRPEEPTPAAAGSLDALKAEAAACRRCPLWKPATQTVFGEGPPDAGLVFVGEQPGDQEDLAGRPFVGPAGQLFDRALAEAGIARDRVYVTNAVKHFKYEPRGKRRIHKSPNNAEIEHCRWWLDQELGLIAPRLTVALGASAARALTGRSVTISRERGRPLTFGDGRAGLITVHPSYLLRIPEDARPAEYARFVADLRQVRETFSASHAA